jgi:hypothetical protein
VPGSAATITLEYIPTPTAITLASQSIDGISGYDRWIVYDVLANLSGREEEDVGRWLHLRNDVEKRFRETAKQNKDKPRQRVSVGRSRRGYPYSY